MNRFLFFSIFLLFNSSFGNTCYYSANGLKQCLNSEKLILTGELSFAFKNLASADKINDILRKFKLTVIYNSYDDPLYFKTKLPKGTDAFKITEAVFQTGLVKWVKPNWLIRYTRFNTPDDPLYSSQWHLPIINASSAWDITTGSPEAMIGIIDDGVEMAHPDLNVTAGADFGSAGGITYGDCSPDSGDYHGTAVSGLAAATGDNTTGVAGVCWKCNIAGVRFVTSDYLPDDRVYLAFKWAVDNGAWVINSSWGYPARQSLGDPCVAPPDDPYITQAVEYAKANGRGGLGTITVWASGNDNCDSSYHPALANQDIISVAAFDEAGTKSYYSVFGDYIDISAPAASVTTSIGGYTTAFGGTSASAPLVAGAIALMLSANPTLSFDEAISCVKRSVFRDFNTVCAEGGWTTEVYDKFAGYIEHSPCFGFGKLDLDKMVRMAVSGECGGAVAAGKKCLNLDDCKAAGTSPICLANWPDGGYCSSVCSDNTTCGINSACVSPDGIIKYCLKTCTDSDVLRDGYVCSKGTAVPKCIEDKDCFKNGFTCEKSTGLCVSGGSKKTGEPCSEDNECAGYGICLNNICSSDCTLFKICGEGESCMFYRENPRLAYDLCFITPIETDDDPVIDDDAGDFDDTIDTTDTNDEEISDTNDINDSSEEETTDTGDEEISDTNDINGLNEAETDASDSEISDTSEINDSSDEELIDETNDIGEVEITDTGDIDIINHKGGCSCTLII